MTFWACYLLTIRDISSKTLLLLLASAMIFGIGMLDDWYKIKGSDLKALPKFIVQFVACVLVYLAA